METKKLIAWCETITKRNKKLGNPASTNYVYAKDGYAVATDSKTLLRVRADMLAPSLTDGYYEVLSGRFIRVPDVEYTHFRFPDYTRVLSRNMHAHMITSRVPPLSGVKDSIAVVVPVHPGDGWTLGKHEFAPAIDCRFLPPCAETEWKIEWLDGPKAYVYPVFFLTDGIEYAIMPVVAKESNPWNVQHTHDGIMWVSRELAKKVENQ